MTLVLPKLHVDPVPSRRTCEKKLVLSKALSTAAERLALTTEQLDAKIVWRAKMSTRC
jgi:hypothetical protein